MLLDRALRSNEAYRQLQTEKFNARLAICEFLALDLIHDEERIAGVDDLSYMNSLLERAGDDASCDAAKNIRDSYAKLGEKYSDTSMRCYSDIEKNIAFHAAQSANNFKPQFDLLLSSGKCSYEDVIKGLTPEHTDYNLTIQKEEVRISQLQHETQVAAAETRTKLRAKNHYYEKDAEFRRRRTEVAKNIYRAKFEEMVKKSGALNYNERMKPLYEFGRADLNEAYARMLAIATGIRIIYGLSEKPIPSADPLDLFDCVAWLRSVRNTLSRMCRSDQNYVLRLSVKSLVGGDKNFINEMAKGRLITVPASAFNGQCFIRVRGLAAYARDLNGSCFYRMKLILPKNATTFHYKNPDPQNVPQENISTCWFGGIGARSILRDSEVTGVQTLYNCSPIGDWFIQLDSDSAAFASREGLNDIELDIHLAVQMQE